MCPILKTKLGKIEISIYFVSWISACLYSLYKLYEVQNELLTSIVNIQLRNLGFGWSILSPLQDTSDFEWSTFKFSIQKSWSFLIFNFIVSEFIRATYKNLLNIWYIIATVFYIVPYLGFKHFIAVIIQPTIYLIIISIGGKKPTVWIICVISLISFHYLKSKYYFWDLFDYENMKEEEMYLLFIALGWIGLRCLSFSFHYIDKWEERGKIKTQEKLKEKNVTDVCINMYSYVLYLPTLHHGPFILYEDFEKSFIITNTKLVSRLKKFIMDVSLYFIYGLIIDFSLHYIHFYAMQEDMKVMRMLPCLALCGGGLWMGLEFQMKYVVFYGMAGAFARLDHINAPPTPRCIARIHVYSQMWRYFDVGLYQFLIKYVYKPTIILLSRNVNLSRTALKLIASFTTFSFIFIWHGTSLSIFIWSVLNYIGITLEQLGRLIVDTTGYRYFKTNILKTDRMEERFIALVCTPLFAMSAISNFYLFSDYKIGNLYFEYCTQPTISNAIIVISALYSCCHVSKALEDIPSRTVYKYKTL